MILPYNPANKESIKKFAMRLLDKSLRMVLDQTQLDRINENRKAKGRMGTILEKYYFLYQPNNASRPDFPEASLELKSTPLKITKGKWVAKERLVLNIINYEKEVNQEWLSSSFWKKNNNLLLMFYMHRSNTPIIDLLFKLIGIWDFPEEDLIILRQDWQCIVEKIKDGKAHELSEGDTFYLGACRKGAGHGKDACSQPNSDIKAERRAYSLKQNYMNLIISQWRNEKEQLESIIKDPNELARVTFENYIINKFRQYYGFTIDEIIDNLGCEINKDSKNLYATLTLRILGVHSNKALEFEKADITIKTVRLKQNNTPKEDISFPYFKFKELVKENWNNSTFRDMLEKKFLFIVYKYDNHNELRLKKAVFWNMPIPDIDNEVQKVWKKTIEKISSGDIDSLPKKSDSPVCHVRPHARNRDDVDELPNGKKSVKRCFWLNSGYIKSQITEDIID